MKVTEFPEVRERARKLRVCCPICGNELMKSSMANDEIKCFRCKEQIVVFLENDRIMITLEHRDRA